MTIRYRSNEATYREFKEGNAVERIIIFSVWLLAASAFAMAVTGIAQVHPAIPKSAMFVPALTATGAYFVLFGTAFGNGFWNLYQGQTWFGEEFVRKEGDTDSRT